MTSLIKGINTLHLNKETIIALLQYAWSNNTRFINTKITDISAPYSYAPEFTVTVVEQVAKINKVDLREEVNEDVQ